MTAYLARITVRDPLDAAERVGMGEALGADADTELANGAVEFSVPGEAPDLPTASIAARRHAGEILDGYAYEVDVIELP